MVQEGKVGGGEAKPQIPVRNLWHMLLYAHDLAVFVNQWSVDLENAPDLDALLAKILCNLVNQRIRIGLGRNYANDARTLRTLRGRVDFGESLKRLTFENGQAFCRFQSFSHNVPKNQIIRSTMSKLVQNGQFGPDRSKGEGIKSELRRLVRALEGVDFCEPTTELIRRQNLGRNDADYRLMLLICDLILRQQMPTESEARSSLPEIDASGRLLHRIYERFVANFYKFMLEGWNVTAQTTLDWYADNSSPFMPGMSADLVLRNDKSGRQIIVDTKFTPNSLIPNRFGKSVFNSHHIYQIYAYLRTQEHLSEDFRKAEGILLYPTVVRELNETIVVQGHSIHFKTVDLSRPWKEIEARLLLIPGGAAVEGVA